jgi:AsmA family protein
VAPDAASVAQPPAARMLQLPDKPLQVTGLQKSDAAVRFHAAVLQAGRFELADASGKLAIEKGVLTISAVHATVAGGTLSGGAQLDASRAVPRGALDMQLAGAQLEQLRGGRAGMGGLSGALDSRIQLTGTGSSWRAMAGSAEGTFTTVMPRGTMRAAIAEAASLELAGALGLMTKSQKETTVRCAVASFGAHDGVLSARTVVVDTDKALITATGTAQLDSEALDFTVRGRPKGPALALRSAVAVRGTLAHPQFKLAGGSAAAQGGVATALAVALTPLAAALAFVSPGLAHDADCSALVASLQADEAGGNPAVAAAKK